MSFQPAVHVLVVSKVRVFAEALVRVLDENSRIRVVGLLTDCASDTALFARAKAPDLILVEASLTSDHRSIARLRSAFPDTRVIAIGVEGDRPLSACFRREVAAAVPLQAGLGALIELVERCAANLPKSQSKMQDLPLDVAIRSRVTQTALPVLTSREHDVIGLIDAGMSNKQIAARLGITVYTVKAHVHNVLTKLGTRNRGAAAAMLRTARDSATCRPLEISMETVD